MLVRDDRNWSHVDVPALGASNTISAAIARAEQRHPGLIPDLRSFPTLLVGSDYSGLHKAAQFEVNTLLITNFETIAWWDEHRSRLRAQRLPHQRRMSYKTLNDGYRREALVSFLDAANQMTGILVTFAIDRRVPSLFTLEDPTDVARRFQMFDGWKGPAIEHAMRILHIASLLLRGLSAPGQDVLWFTDEDDIVANEGRLRTFVSAFATISSHYLPHPLRHLRIGTTMSDTGRRDIEDYVAITDITAGAFQDLLSAGGAKHLLDNPSIFLPPSQALSRKARVVMDWYSDNTQPLRRLAIVIDEPHPGKPRITTIRAHLSSD
jgi:hypothetical protein